MEAAITSAAQLIYDLIVPPMAEKINSIWNNEERIEELADTVDLIRDVLYDVEGKRFQEKSMNRCYKRLRNAFLDAEDFLDRVQTLKMKKDLETRRLKEEEEEINKGKGKLKRTFGLLGNKLKPLIIEAQRFISKENQVNYALEVSGMLTEVKRKLNAIAKDMQTFGLKVPSTSLAPTQMAARASGPYVNPTNIFGRDEDKRKIVELLLRSPVDQSKIPVVSIVAPGGMGKTTVAQLVYNDKSWQESCPFKHKLWVSDSKRLDLESLLKHVLKSICPNQTGLDNLKEDHLKLKIVEIIQGERFFLVLDDVVNENRLIWDNLKMLLDCGSKESRILVTTRSRQVAKVVGSIKSTHELIGLSKEDSSQLFESFAFGGTRDESLVGIGKVIVEKCCGVPLAIRVVGSLLRDEGKRKWEYFRDNSLTEKADEGNQIMDILNLSYTNLDPTLQRCFSLCALFPKNYRIHRETLSDIWMANVGFKTWNGETIEDVCEKSLKILYNRCFLELDVMKRDHNDTHLLTHDEFDDVEYFKLHDLMHDLVRKVAGDEILVVDSDKLHIKEDVRHIMLDYRTSKFEPKGRRVRSFLVEWNYYRILNFDKFVLDYPVLRYLDVSGGVIENLTESIGKLVHLRYLCLSESSFQTLPHSIAELINLRTLELQNCGELTHLPSRMGELTCLEVLDLYNCRKLEELPGSIEKLMKLKKLILERCKGLTHLPPGMGALASLEVLDISSCSELKELPRNIEKLMKLKKLILKICEGLTHLPPGMGALASLEVLDISWCFQLKELPMSIEKLMKLKKLILKQCKGLTHLPPGMGALASLEVLDISHCLKLKELPRGIEKLMKLKKFLGCWSLASMPPGMSALLGVCEPAVFIVGDLEESSHTAQLEELRHLSDLPEKLVIMLRGKGMAWIEGGDGDETFTILLNKTSLRKLDIHWNPGEDVEEEVGRKDVDEDVGRNQMEVLGMLQPPTSLEELTLRGYNGMAFPGWMPRDGFASALPNLASLHLQGCGEFRFLPPLRGLDRLRVLVLDGLSSLEYIVEEEDDSDAPICLPQLESLTLRFLAKFKGWCRGKDTEDSVVLPSLSNIEIQKCPNLTAPIRLSVLKAFDLSSSSFDHLFAQVCNDGEFVLSECKGDSLKLEIKHCEFTERASSYMEEAFRGASHGLTHLAFRNCEGLKTLPGLHHLTALRELSIEFCCDFTWEEEDAVEEEQMMVEEDEVGDEMETTPHHMDSATTPAHYLSWKRLTSLHKLTLGWLPKLLTLPEGLQYITSLHGIEVLYCGNFQVPDWAHKTYNATHFGSNKFFRKK